MKRSIWITAIIVLIIIVIGVSFDSDEGPTSKTNSKVVKDYPALNDNVYLNYSVFGAGQELKDLSDLTVGKIYFSNNLFYCETGDSVNRIVYSSYSAGKDVEGGWGGIDVLDCGDYYYILSYGDHPRSYRIHGSFDK